MIDPGLPVLCFALLGIAAAIAQRQGHGRARLLLNLFIGYTLAVSFGAGLTQRELWPFSSWPLVATTVPDPVTQPRIVALGADGLEHEIDHRAWAPLVFQEVTGWHGKHLVRMDSRTRDGAFAHLLGVVEGNRRRWAEGRPEPWFTRYLGPFSAPFFLGHPDRWDEPAAVPRTTFVGLRLYRETWSVEERRLDPSKVRRTLAYEYRAP
jgi:hypothetical protein